MNKGAFKNATRSWFVSKPLALAAGGVAANLRHGLGGTPHLVRWVLVCLTSEGGYTPGDEVDIPAASTGYMEFASGANGTNVFLIMDKTGSGATNFAWVSKTDGTETTFTLSKWQAKCYAYRDSFIANP